MRNNYKWILFDLSGVVSTWSFRSTKWKTINKKKYIELNFEDIYEKKYYSKFELGKIPHKKFVENYLKRTNTLFTFNEFVKIFKRSVTPFKGTSEILKKLKKNYKLAILSNEGTQWANYKLDGAKSRKYFDKVIISGQIGAAKPSKKFFDKSLKILKTKPKLCVFVDDLEENTDAAEKFGIKSILFKTAPQLKKDLKKFEISS